MHPCPRSGKEACHARDSCSRRPFFRPPVLRFRQPSRGRQAARTPLARKVGRPASRQAARGQPPAGEAEHDILFQKFFKSVGPRTYAAQVKRASNGNHYLVLMEGKRDEANGEVRKTRLFVYSEDFVEFFRLVKSAAEFIKANPVPPEVAAKREKFWAKQAAGAKPRPPRRAMQPRPASARAKLKVCGTRARCTEISGAR